MAASALLLATLAVSLTPGDSRFIIETLPSTQQESTAADTCSGCSQIIRLSANMISSKDAKETVYESLRALCQQLPPSAASECASQVKMYLPKILQQTPGHLEAAATCSAFHLCDSAESEDPLGVGRRGTAEDASALGAVADTHKLFNPACTLCLFIIKKLESLLPQNMTEDALVKIMSEVCDLIPSSYKDQCDDFVDKYGAQIVEFLLSSAAPHTICMLLHICLFKDPSVPEVLAPSDCESCRTLAVLSRLHLGLNSTQPQTSSFLQSVCALHPNAIPKCESFVRIYGSRLQQAFGNKAERPDVCERADICAATKKLEMFGNNPCTWGPSYWCKDMKSAQQCNNLAFCEKHMWKKNP